MLKRVLALAGRGGDSPAAVSASLLKRQRLLARISTLVPYLRSALLLGGFLYLLALPTQQLGRGHYVSENALQPSQVNTYWNWADVHIADQHAKDVAKWTDSHANSNTRAAAIRDAFTALGLPSATQSYSFLLSSSNETLSGTNVYSILQAPKTDGAEALVLSASWLSRALDENGERRVNTRGIALVLALANYLKKYSMWSKDIIFLVSDGYADGAQAWLDSYHGFDQSNLQADPLPLTTGPIWAALNLDYPHHSFSHAGIFYEGANGHLPNLDFVNSASHILKHSGIPPILHLDVSLADVLPTPFFATPLAFLDTHVLRTYFRAVKVLAHQVALEASGIVAGPEGVYGRYRIDALTLFAVPAEGPHGFHALGRAVESTFRSLNNLLERFHASFFLYLMTSVDTFISVANYLAAPILISAGMTITGFMLWSEASSPSSSATSTGGIKQLSTGGVELRRAKPVGKAAAAIGLTHLVGGFMFALVSRLDPTSPIPPYLPPTLLFLLAFTPLLLSLLLTPLPSLSLPLFPLSATLKSFTLLLGGLLIALTATLNFGLATLLALTLPPPLLLSSPRSTELGANLQQLVLMAWSPAGAWSLWWYFPGGGRVGAEAWLQGVVLDWKVFGTWGLPVGLGVVAPLGLLASTVALL